MVAIGYSTVDKGALTELYEGQLHEDINRVSMQSNSEGILKLYKSSPNVENCVSRTRSVGERCASSNRVPIYMQ